MFWQNGFLARPHLCSVSECSFMPGPYTPNAVHSATNSLLAWAFPPLMTEKAFSTVFCIGCDMAPVLHRARVKLQSVQFHCHWQSCQSGGQQPPSLAFCQMLAVMCFGSWTTGLFLAKYQILRKMPLTGITLGPRIHLKSLQQDTNSQSDFGIHTTMEKFRH